MVDDPATTDRLELMEHKLYRFMTPLGVLALGFGVWLWVGYGISGGWLHIKLLLVTILVAYHLYCGKLLQDFRHHRNRHSHIWYRWFNELPVMVLFAVIFLVELKPF
jgi:putative membrane protein